MCSTVFDTVWFVVVVLVMMMLIICIGRDIVTGDDLNRFMAVLVMALVGAAMRVLAEVRHLVSRDIRRLKQKCENQ